MAKVYKNKALKIMLAMNGKPWSEWFYYPIVKKKWDHGLAKSMSQETGPRVMSWEKLEAGQEKYRDCKLFIGQRRTPF